MLSALLIMLVRVKLASGSKKDARGGEGGRGRLFVGIDLCGGGAGDPPPRPGIRTGMGRGGGAGPQGRAPGETRGQSSPPPGARRCPVPLNSTKKGYACS